MNVLSIGEVLWDVFGDTEYLGGAALNFAAHARILGHSVSFLSAVGDDPRGQRIVEKMEAMGLPTRFLHQVKEHPTGIVTVNLDASGQPHFTIHRPAAYDFPEPLRRGPARTRFAAAGLDLLWHALPDEPSSKGADSGADRGHT